MLGNEQTSVNKDAEDVLSLTYMKTFMRFNNFKTQKVLQLT